MAKVGYSAEVREEAKQKRKALVCIDVDCRYLPESAGRSRGRVTLEGPFPPEQAARVLAVIREMLSCKPE